MGQVVRQRVDGCSRRGPLVGALLFVCVLSGYLLSFNVDQPAHNGDWFLRYQVACSIVERDSFAIRPYQQDARSGPGQDHQLYTEYTLGQSVALVPLYMLGRALAGRAHTDCDAPVAVPIVLLTCKLLDPILGALLCVLFYATARLLRYSPGTSLALALLLAFGTSLWPDVLSNLEHTMESLFLLAAFYAALRLARGPDSGRLWVLAMGLAAGLIFLTRVSGLLALPIFALYLLILHWHRRSEGWPRPWLRDEAIYVAGVLPSVAINLAYNQLRFGSPFRFEPVPGQSLGYPLPSGIANLLISPGKGLIWYTPAVLLAIPAVRRYWRRSPRAVLLSGLICAAYLLFYGQVVYWHGDPAWGPRYLFALLPYLILPAGELLGRWTELRRSRRAPVVGVLAASILVQLAAASVSFWRQFHYVMGAYPAQVVQYSWGFDMNYYWKPDQSPIAVSLAGIAAITHDYVDHAPLLQHGEDQRLGAANEGCSFRVYGRASICLTDLDAVRYRANWNTFTMWWLHPYSWWSTGTVALLALLLQGIFVATGALLLAYHGAAIRLPRPRAPTRAGYPRRQEQAAASRPLALAGLLAALCFGAIMLAGALDSPSRATPLVQAQPMGARVVQGQWSYAVESMRRLPVPARDGSGRSSGRTLVLVRLRFHNTTARWLPVPQQRFALVAGGGRMLPLAPLGAASAAGVYRLAITWPFLRPRGDTVSTLVYLAPASARGLALLGPGIALTPL